MLEADAFTGYPGVSIIKIKRLYRMKTSFCTDAFYEEIRIFITRENSSTINRKTAQDGKRRLIISKGPA